MKNTFTLLAFLSVLSISGFSQVNCKLLNDSITEGDDISDTRTYFYNESGQLIKVMHYYASWNEFDFDTVKYSNGLIDSVIQYYIDQGNVNVKERAGFTYNGNNQVTRVMLSGDNGSGPWTMAHDVDYNGNGEITDVILDDASITGPAEGFRASFRNMVWTNGNITYVELIGDLGRKVIDTLELSITYDDKKNVEKHFLIDEAPDLIMHYNTNNILEMSFINDEAMGNAGTVAMSYAYTYNEYDEVATRTEFPGVFNSDSLVRQFNYDCGLGIENVMAKNIAVSVYPNPVYDQLNIDIDNLNLQNRYEICGIDGKLFNKGFINKETNSINVSNLNTGVYFIKIFSKSGNAIQKFIKQ